MAKELSFVMITGLIARCKNTRGFWARYVFWKIPKIVMNTYDSWKFYKHINNKIHIELTFRLVLNPKKEPAICVVSIHKMSCSNKIIHPAKYMCLKNFFSYKMYNNRIYKKS